MIYSSDSCIITMRHPDGTVTGSTRRIQTNIIAGWCGVDMPLPVKFTWKRGTLNLYVGYQEIEVKHYAAMVRKSEIVDGIRQMLSYDDKHLDRFLVKEASEC